jgi:hypothetical protein
MRTRELGLATGFAIYDSISRKQQTTLEQIAESNNVK